MIFHRKQNVPQRAQRTQRKTNSLLCVLCVLCGTFVGGANADAATPAEVDAAVKKGIESLYAMQKNGTWETVDTPGELHDSTEGGQWGGLTGLTTYALLAAGEKPTDPRIKSAVDFL